MTAICVERGTFTSEDWRKEVEVEVEVEEEGDEEDATEPLFSVGQKVAENSRKTLSRKEKIISR